MDSIEPGRRLPQKKPSRNDPAPSIFPPSKVMGKFSTILEVTFDCTNHQACRDCGVVSFVGSAWGTANRATGWDMEDVGTYIGESVTVASAAGFGFRK